ncbi:GNAT family N-acetyltransferase [Clostridium estertheticum]|uniref:GNAT family N-acetyltransferase n=1 Tax=Clostridium estertheticum TaxID=238834 RepID=UPI001C6E9B9A|nr:GNAT family N-acetyltransferase [Clostridium estertheticum]MBW9171203.1 GNAT family N-acetyltransferase [Clostridium estertheticum]WLC73939.1 GNAT family N-acetyltransferase [Clostridium estertheticum]
MELKIKHKAKSDSELIIEVMKLDKMGYPNYMQGTFDTIYARFKKNEDSFILAYHENKLVGYLCFFPISDNLLNKIYKDDDMYDTDILPKDIRSYGKEGIYNIFIISIVVHPDYQGSDVIKHIAESFVRKIQIINVCGNSIGKIVANAVSYKGKNFLEKMNFTNKRILNEGYLLYECFIEDLYYLGGEKRYE